MRVARDVRQQVEGHLLAAAGQQHEDALGLLDRRPAGHGGLELLDLGLQRPDPLGLRAVAGRLAVTSMQTPSTALTPPVGSSSGSPSRTTVRCSPSARTIRFCTAERLPRGAGAGERLQRAGAVVGVLVVEEHLRARAPPSRAAGRTARTSPATTTRRWCAGRTGTGRRVVRASRGLGEAGAPALGLGRAGRVDGRWRDRVGEDIRSPSSDAAGLAAGPTAGISTHGLPTGNTAGCSDAGTVRLRPRSRTAERHTDGAGDAGEQGLSAAAPSCRDRAFISGHPALGLAEGPAPVRRPAAVVVRRARRSLRNGRVSLGSAGMRLPGRYDGVARPIVTYGSDPVLHRACAPVTTFDRGAAPAACSTCSPAWRPPTAWAWPPTRSASTPASSSSTARTPTARTSSATW